MTHQWSPFALVGWTAVVLGGLSLEIGARFNPRIPYFTTLVTTFIHPLIQAASIGMLAEHFLIQHAKSIFTK